MAKWCPFQSTSFCNDLIYGWLAIYYMPHSWCSGSLGLVSFSLNHHRHHYHLVRANVGLLNTHRSSQEKLYTFHNADRFSSPKMEMIYCVKRKSARCTWGPNERETKARPMMHKVNGVRARKFASMAKKSLIHCAHCAIYHHHLCRSRTCRYLPSFVPLIIDG